ncbi:MAG: hypothetical protein ACRYGI_14485 [Janthinobacterium lividum]
MEADHTTLHCRVLAKMPAAVGGRMISMRGLWACESICIARSKTGATANEATGRHDIPRKITPDKSSARSSVDRLAGIEIMQMIYQRHLHHAGRPRPAQQVYSLAK